ncbi:hypothetical protein NDU88_003177 [Pleurodeles waltl]|uniref:Uncharacterized protein n=1 Tax=Pleurodeles waltl TaxID=8319 RepID=A0AAV7WNC5_PLEWA|nr:hypothetical protein NDU88_003177 [Pleurodeles waltl]
MTPHHPCGCSCCSSPIRGFPPNGDGGPHDLPGWTPYSLTYLRCTLELFVGLYPEDPDPGGSETLVTTSYPQRAAPMWQLILPFTGVPYFGSLHIALAAHVPQTPGGTFIYVCTRRGDRQLRRASDALEDATWLTPHSKRRKRKSSKAGPSRAQAVTEQEKAIQEAAHFSHNSFLALSDKF